MRGHARNILGSLIGGGSARKLDDMVVDRAHRSFQTIFDILSELDSALRVVGIVKSFDVLDKRCQRMRSEALSFIFDRTAECMDARPLVPENRALKVHNIGLYERNLTLASLHEGHQSGDLGGHVRIVLLMDHDDCYPPILIVHGYRIRLRAIFRVPKMNESIAFCRRR